MELWQNLSIGRMPMKKIEERIDLVHRLIKEISANRDQLIETAVKDAGFTLRECRIEVDMNLDNLRSFDEMVTVFSERQPICRPDQEVALLLPYNGSAWLNTAILSIFLVGNRVRVKFATRGSDISRFTESLYKPIFGDAICFEYTDGRSFLENAMSNPNIPAICLFGSDDHALQYQNSVVGATQDMLGVREETFGPVSFVSTFNDTHEALRLVRDNRYGLRASVYGDEKAVDFGNELVGEAYCHPVDKMVFGKFGTVGVNQGRSETWKGAFVSKPVGGYGYSGWIWETMDDKFILKQGPKLLSLETSQKTY